MIDWRTRLTVSEKSETLFKIVAALVNQTKDLVLEFDSWDMDLSIYHLSQEPRSEATKLLSRSIGLHNLLEATKSQGPYTANQVKTRNQEIRQEMGCIVMQCKKLQDSLAFVQIRLNQMLDDLHSSMWKY